MPVDRPGVFKLITVIRDPQNKLIADKPTNHLLSHIIQTVIYSNDNFERPNTEFRSFVLVENDR